MLAARWGRTRRCAAEAAPPSLCSAAVLLQLVLLPFLTLLLASGRRAPSRQRAPAGSTASRSRARLAPLSIPFKSYGWPPLKSQPRPPLAAATTTEFPRHRRRFRRRWDDQLQFLAPTPSSLRRTHFPSLIYRSLPSCRAADGARRRRPPDLVAPPLDTIAFRSSSGVSFSAFLRCSCSSSPAVPLPSIVGVGARKVEDRRLVLELVDERGDGAAALQQQ